LTSSVPVPRQLFPAIALADQGSAPPAFVINRARLAFGPENLAAIRRPGVWSSRRSTMRNNTGVSRTLVSQSRSRSSLSRRWRAEAITKPGGRREGSCAPEGTGHLGVMLEATTHAHPAEGQGRGMVFAGVEGSRPPSETSRRVLCRPWMTASGGVTSFSGVLTQPERARVLAWVGGPRTARGHVYPMADQGLGLEAGEAEVGTAFLHGDHQLSGVGTQLDRAIACRAARSAKRPAFCRSRRSERQVTP